LLYFVGKDSKEMHRLLERQEALDFYV